MRKPYFKLLSPKEIRKLRSIAPEGSPPDASLPLASFAVTGVAPPRVTTEVRPLATTRGKGWQVTVSAADLDPQFMEPPKFELNRLRAPKRIRVRPDRFSLINDPYRPQWIGFNPEPKLVRSFAEPILTYRERRLTPLSIQGGVDNRRVYRDTTYPWGCVCKVTSGSKGGSGVLIGPRHVLTASHAIDWNAGWAVVDVHRFDNSFTGGSCALGLWRFTEIDDPEPSTVDEDYAVITVFDRLGDRFGWMGNMTYNSSWDDDPFFRTIGYADEIAGANRPVHQSDFHLDEDEFDYGTARAMTCGADLTKGQSGSPIFAFGKHDDMPYVVAVASAGGDDGNNYCAGGSLLTRLVREVRQAVP